MTVQGLEGEECFEGLLGPDSQGTGVEAPRPKILVHPPKFQPLFEGRCFTR